MHFIKRELQLVEERHGGKYGLDDEDKMEGRRIMDKKLSKHTEAVAKLHESLESKIMARHNELWKLTSRVKVFQNSQTTEKEYQGSVF